MLNMLKFFKIIFVYFLLSLTVIYQSNSQTPSTDNNFLLQNFILSLEGGLAYGSSDYKNATPGPAFRGSIEYYPIIIQNSRLGVKAFAGGLTLKFNDTRNLISSNDGLRDIPDHISTDGIQIGSGISFGYAFNDYFIPSITVGGTFLKFSPKDSDGKIRPFNKADVYKKEIISFYFEGELKIKISERFSVNTQLSYYPTSSDYLDDVSASTNNDTYLTGMLGISYAFTGNFDSDGDGIKDNVDICPDSKEDFDGFEDEDGCPDPDNDKDGILDLQDKCPDQAEDKDGFEDWDGCPDLDNDKDGIWDVNDNCPDEAEDIDGFQDEDGCPDVDNDGDGILDINDKCPDQPETINNFEDGDGCPDAAQQETFYQFNLRGDDTFNNGSSNLTEAAKLVLNEIAFYIQNQPKSKWRIEGHMDSQGSSYTIKKLSYDRARSAYDYLITQGVLADQLEVYGLGDSFPIGNNNSAEGRSSNRRIMIIRED
ncbi:MAG: OmpA family protein [Ignavibacteriales bacterium]|nr:OmpA family protein [Ignavibacteriales bacterium]